MLVRVKFKEGFKLVWIDQKDVARILENRNGL